MFYQNNYILMYSFRVLTFSFGYWHWEFYDNSKIFEVTEALRLASFVEIDLDSVLKNIAIDNGLS